MYPGRLRWVIDRLKRVLRKDQRLTVAEFNQLLQLAEAIVDYGRMIQGHYGHYVPNVRVGIPELASRFRELPQTIKDALELLRGQGRAEPLDLPGCWKLKLANILLSGREAGTSATRHSRSAEEDEGDLGAA